MKKVKFCLVGAGRAGMVNARNFEFNIAESEVVAVIDPNLKAARKAAEELNANDYYSNLGEALIKSDFDAVCIGAPTFVHCEAVVKAAEAGKHIYSEKPLSISLKEANKMEEAIKKNKVKFQIDFMRRFDKNFLKAKKLIEDRAIGTSHLKNQDNFKLFYATLFNSFLTIYSLSSVNIL